MKPKEERHPLVKGEHETNTIWYFGNGARYAVSSYNRKSYGLSTGIQIGDLEWPWTVFKTSIVNNSGIGIDYGRFNGVAAIYHVIMMSD